MVTENRVIEVTGVTRRFGRKLVLRGIDLTVEEGKFLTVYGPNGAGKTTFTKVLATLLKPSSGTVTITGLDLKDNQVEIRRRIGVVGHQTSLYDELTVYENLNFYGRMYDVPNLDERIRELIAAVDMESRFHDRVRVLSRGMQQRLSIARALIHNPPVILLDEPETGLDQYAGEMFLNLMNNFDPGKRTAVMTTHSLERGLELCNHVAILTKGRIAYEESKQSLNLTSLREAYRHFTGATK